MRELTIRSLGLLLLQLIKPIEADINNKKIISFILNF